MKVYLIRHTSPDVPKGTCYGQTDVPLATTFPNEAAATLAGIPDIKFDMVYSSPLTRAQKLAAFCGYPTPRLDNRLKELNFGRWEMQMYDEIDDPYIQEWYNNFVDAPIPGGESFREMYLRIADFLDELKQKDYNNVLIFAHGGVLACANVYVGKATLRTAFENLIPYGGMLTIEIQYPTGRLATCKAHNVNPRLYLNSVIADMPYQSKATKEELLQMLPHKWINRHPEAILKKEKQEK